MLPRHPGRIVFGQDNDPKPLHHVYMQRPFLPNLQLDRIDPSPRNVYSIDAVFAMVWRAAYLLPESANHPLESPGVDQRHARNLYL
jgi:hypothetical protein